MKTKIFGLAVMLSLAAVLGACENPGTTPTGTTTTPAEPADTGATPAITPAVTTTPAASPNKAP